ncbi:cytochrome P450 4V2-like isoform X2 [Rhipicephalus microplus]|uniref:cytochrome P450 4V2-like isoform X2 n=1 Tax=Rhipicephalus microplus TaxID=6941 RepID=UPI003F6B2FD4
MSASAAVHYVLIIGKLVAAIGLAIIIYLCAKLTCQWIRMYYYLRHVPRVKEKWPFSLLLDTWMALRKMDRNLPITAKFFNYLEDITSKVYEQDVAIAYYGPQPFLLGVSPTVFEAILSSNVNLNKSFIYRMMKPWMGNGVLTSDRETWRTRRKILTPAFHFKILDNYMHIMNRRTKEAVDKLMQLGEKPFDILPILRLAAFGMLFETAMGVNINEEEVTNKKLLHTTDDLAASIISRVLKVFNWSDTLYYMTQEGKSFLKKARYIREYNEKIIQQRKAQYISGEAGCGSRKSFLDILLHMHIDEKTLTEQEVAEEVATFFIGGFDTTAMATSYTLYLLGHNSGIQDKVHAEIDTIFANDKQRSVTAEDIKKLKYLECVIKESLRLYPPVPLVARNIDEDMHIGQRFAQLEEKIMLTHILRNFRVESLVRKEELQLQLEIVLRPLQGIQLKLTPR